MINYYYIVRRANSEYTHITNGLSWLEAEELAAKMQRENDDGEYFTRHMFDKPEGKGSSSYQSGFDYL